MVLDISVLRSSRFLHKKHKFCRIINVAYICFVVSFLISGSLWAECPALDISKTPRCPKTGVLKLDNTFPSTSYVVGDDVVWRFKDDHSKIYAANTTLAIIEAQSKIRANIFLPVDQETYRYVREKVEKELKGRISSRELEQTLSRLIFVQKEKDVDPWMQDSMVSLIDPKTGNIIVRPTNNKAVQTVRGIVETASNQCSKVTLGTPFPSNYLNTPFKGEAYGGGNIEGLPGGLCMHGNNQTDSEFIKSYCGNDKSNEVIIDTSWLSVGHVDEIISIVPNSKKRFPCNFAINTASPQLAMELLEKNKDDLFFELADKSINLADIQDDREGYGQFAELCELRKKELNPTTCPCTTIANRPPALGAEILLALEKEIQDKKIKRKGAYLPFGEVCESIYLQTLTNRSALNIFRNNERLRSLNALAQHKMDENKKILREAIQKKLPQCNVEFIDVPNLFTGAAATKTKDGKWQLNEGSLGIERAKSLLPNPTNGLMVEETVLVPEPQNKAFKTYLSSAWLKHGVRSSFVDTLLAGHIGVGNLHCLTNSFRTCRP